MNTGSDEEIQIENLIAVEVNDTSMLSPGLKIASYRNTELSAKTKTKSFLGSIRRNSSESPIIKPSSPFDVRRVDDIIISPLPQFETEQNLIEEQQSSPINSVASSRNAISKVRTFEDIPKEREIVTSFKMDSQLSLNMLPLPRTQEKTNTFLQSFKPIASELELGEMGEKKHKQIKFTSAVDKWKKTKRALHAVVFQREAQTALDQKTNRVMRGYAKEKNKIPNQFEVFIHPKSAFKKGWDLMILFSMVYYSFILPIRWSQNLDSSKWQQFDYLSDAVIWIDIVLSGLTARIVNGYIIKDFREIMRHYSRTYLVPDVVTALPLYVIREQMIAIKILRSIHLPRGYKVLRSALVGYPRLLRCLEMFKIIFLIICFFGFLDAGWIFAGDYDLKKITWMTFQPPFSHSFGDVMRLFLVGMHFVITTVTTVGFGDILPVSIKEYIIVMVLQFLCIVVFSFIAAQIIYVIRKEGDQVNAKKQFDLETWLLRQENARKKFQNEDVRRFSSGNTSTVINNIQSYFALDRTYNQSDLTRDDQFFALLPPNLQDQVTMLTFGPKLEKFSIFFGFFSDKTFKNRLVTALKPLLIPPEKMVVKRGNKAKGLYFVLKGFVKLTYKDVPLFVQEQGSFFGEYSALERASKLDFKADKRPLECLFIDKDELRNIMSQHPESMNILKKMILQKEMFYNQMINQVLQDIETAQKYMNTARKVTDESELSIPVLGSIIDKDLNIPKSPEPEGTLKSIESLPPPPKGPTFYQRVRGMLNRKKMSTLLTESTKSTRMDTIIDKDMKIDSDCEDPDELNNSMEVPIDNLDPEFEDPTECNDILSYIDQRISTMDSRLKRILNANQESVLTEWKAVRAFKKKRYNDVNLTE